MSSSLSRSHYRRLALVARRPAGAIRSLSTEPVSQQNTRPPPEVHGGASHAHPAASKPAGPGPSRATPASRTLFNPAPRSASTGSSTRAPPPFLPYLSPSFGRNQRLAVSDSTRALLERIVGNFHAPIRYAFAYGSGVFEQKGYDAQKRPMLDFVFAVTHPDHWHSINMHQHPHHYPLHARVLGSSFVSRVQNVEPGVWFNAFVEMEGVVRSLVTSCRLPHR
jgi:mitochondrial translocator assembly and maintenance protein 41